MRTFEVFPELFGVNTKKQYSQYREIAVARLPDDVHLRCFTQEEIGEAVGLNKANVNRLCCDFPDLEYRNKLTEKEASTYPITAEMVADALHEDEDFQQPIYNVWAFGKKTNETEHFGNTEQRIVDNLLWLYTKPFDIVVDPFGGGGSTLDVCRRRLRRCWISDRKPKPGNSRLYIEQRLKTPHVRDQSAPYRIPMKLPPMRYKPF